MSSCSSYCSRMRDALLANDKTAMIETYNEFQVSNCYYPQRVRVYDAHTQTARFITVPCGRCYHCMETKVNSWVTRMYAHAEDYKYVYFITLTYRSFYAIRDVERLMLDKLKDACWHKDSFNSTGRVGYNPCLLIKSHYQNFIKRLRKNTNNTTLSYVLCGEYGKRYSRPHFHAILFSNQPISRDDVVRAWSVALWRDVNGRWSLRTNQRSCGQSYNFPIGRVDYNDLVTNGTFNTTALVRVDDTYMSAGRCFAYVCKYVCKRDNANTKRVGIAYNAMYQKQKYVKVFHDEVAWKNISSFLREKGYSIDTSQFKQFIYEKTILSFRDTLYHENLPATYRKTCSGVSFDLPYYPSEITEFRSRFAPFVEFSRGVAIGSLYAKSHISEFTQGVFNKPLLQDKGFVVPSYFRRKTQDFLFRFHEMRKSITGITYPLGGLVDRLRHLSDVAEGVVSSCYTVPAWRTSEDYNKLVKVPQYVLRDAWTGERVIQAAGRAMYFKYDRATRQYVRTRQLPVADFIRSCCTELQCELVRHADIMSRVTENERLRKQAECYLASADLDMHTLRDTFVSAQDAYLHTKQRDYDMTHVSCE